MITKIALEGYRLLDGFEADFGQLTVVIGANASGKSTLMDFLQFLCQCTMHPLSQVAAVHGGIGSVLTASHPVRRIRWQVTLRKPDRTDFWQAMPMEEDRELVYDVTLESDQYGQPRPVSEELRNAQPHTGYTEPFKLLQADPRRTMIFSPRASKLIEFDDSATRGEPEASPPKGGFGAPEPPKVAEEERTLRLAQMRFLNEYPLPSWVRMLIASWAFYTEFDVTRSGPIRSKPAEIQPVTVLAENGENLGTVLHEVLTRAVYRDAVEDLRAYLSSAYPFFEDFFAETAYGTPPKVLVRVREHGMSRPLELWDMSDGFLRFLCLASVLANPVPPPLVGIDEPEAGLHPRLMPVLADMIRAASERTQVLVATHSPELLSCFGLEDVAVMVREETRVLWHRPGSRSNLRRLLETVAGETLGDLHRSGELESVG